MTLAGPLARREVVAAQADPAAFFADVEQAFERAVRAVGTVERSFAIGGLAVRLRFAGEALVDRLTRALSHLSIEPLGSRELEIGLWDTASTSVAPPPAAWGSDAYGARSEIVGFNDDTIHTAFQLDSESLLIFDASRDRAYYWSRASSSLPVHEGAAPLRTILHWWMRRRDRQFVHAGAVGTAAGGVLLAGEGGAGKSSSALACLGSSLSYASDDYCLVDLSVERPVVYSVYSSAKLHAADLRQFPDLQAHVVNPERLGEEKAVIFLHPEFAASLIPSFPLRAVLLPRVVERRDTRLVPVPRRAVVASLAPTSIAQLPGAGLEVVQRMAQLARAVPAYALELGSDRARIAPVIAELLASLPD